MRFEYDVVFILNPILVKEITNKLKACSFKTTPAPLPFPLTHVHKLPNSEAFHKAFRLSSSPFCGTYSLTFLSLKPSSSRLNSASEFRRESRKSSVSIWNDIIVG